MVRAPCCWAKGLKKGPWTHEEDEILKSFVEKHGHDNWRALPKLAGLLRCGKSCRLRWLNYLRPEVKLGNFTREEDEIIIKTHATLGNKWSAIAAQLPGRTDNEIKNTWHTRLKKRVALNLKQPIPNGNDISESSQQQHSEEPLSLGSPRPPQYEVDSRTAQAYDSPIFSPQNSHDVISSADLSGGARDHNMETDGTDIDLINSLGSFLGVDGSFWLDPIPADYFTEPWKLASCVGDMLLDPNEVSPSTVSNYGQIGMWHADDPNTITSDDGLEFWFDLFANSQDLEQLLDEFAVS